MPTRRFALLGFFVFFSGAAALGIEVVWSRMLQRILGSTATAVTLVVAGYLAGMGLGAHVGERCLARVGNSVRAYAACELVAAALVLVCTLLFRDPLLATLPGGTVWLLLMVVLASVPLGATFPFLFALLPLIHARRWASSQCSRGWKVACVVYTVGTRSVRRSASSVPGWCSFQLSVSGPPCDLSSL